MAYLRSTVDPGVAPPPDSPNILPLLHATASVGSAIRATEQRACIVCGGPGRLLYRDLEDRLFHAPGLWTFFECERRTCGTIWLNPRPCGEDLGHAYVDYYTHRDDAGRQRTWPRRLHDFLRDAYLARAYGYTRPTGSAAAALCGWIGRIHPARRAIWDFAVMMLPSTPGGRLLDVGCGSGTFLRFARELGWHVEGVDPDPAAVAAARNGGLPVRLGDLPDVALPSESFHAVTMSHVIEHVPDPAALLREVHRILRPGGLAAIATPNRRSLMHRWFAADWRGLEPPRHLQLFTLPAIAHAMTDAGFTIVRSRTGLRDANNMYVASRRLRFTGRHVHGDRGSRRLRLRGHAALLREWLSLWRDPEAGEEITILGRK